ncbi:hypothetical protein [Krasilnikovia sp. MM14-A1004]|uniref:hypothetical protein n=1 Tax=Krasilnikovia sp. MM14-A1004 TaxID=3373541 RepID=UPI00399CFBE3
MPEVTEGRDQRPAAPPPTTGPPTTGPPTTGPATPGAGAAAESGAAASRPVPVEERARQLASAAWEHWQKYGSWGTQQGAALASLVAEKTGGSGSRPVQLTVLSASVADALAKSIDHLGKSEYFSAAVYVGHAANNFAAIYDVATGKEKSEVHGLVTYGLDTTKNVVDKAYEWFTERRAQQERARRSADPEAASASTELQAVAAAGTSTRAPRTPPQSRTGSTSPPSGDVRRRQTAPVAPTPARRATGGR